jgi:hypothetical protein
MTLPPPCPKVQWALASPDPSVLSVAAMHDKQAMLAVSVLYVFEHLKQSY